MRMSLGIGPPMLVTVMLNLLQYLSQDCREKAVLWNPQCAARG